MVTLRADMNSPVQENFCGLGAIYHAFAGMPDSAGRVYSNELCELEAKRVADMRVKVVRSYFSWYAWNSQTNTWDWNNARCTAFYNWARRLKAYGVEIAINTGWVNVGDLQGDYWGGLCPFTVKGNWAATVDGYAKWVSELIYQLIEKRGLDNIKYFNLFTEPNENVCPSKPFEDAKYHELWYECSIAVHKQLIADGRRDKIMLMGPQEGICSCRPWFTEWALNEKHCDEFLDCISMHNYLNFNEADPSDVHSGNKSLIFPFSGSRSQCRVSLKKHTEYTMSVWLKIKKFAEITPQSEMVFGIFGKGSFNHYFHDCCDMRDAISVCHVKGERLRNEWQQFKFTFNSGDNESVNACLLSNMSRADGQKDSLWFGLPYEKNEGVCVLADDISLREKDCGTELLHDNSYEGGNDWYHLWCRINGTDAYEMWQTFERSCLKVIPNPKKNPYWHDEYNYGGMYAAHYGGCPEYGIYLALGEVAMMNEGGQGSFLWTLFDQQWPNNHSNSNDSFVDGDHRCGLMPVLTRSKIPYPGYYAWGVISRYTGGRGTRSYKGINCSEERIVMNVNEMPDGNITFCVVNYSDKMQDINIKVNRYLNRDFFRHSYVTNEIVPDENAILPEIDKAFEHVSDSIKDTIKPMSIAVYTTMKD